MKRVTVAMVLALVLVLVGCASPDYAQYTAAHTARTQADAKRLESIAQIGREAQEPMSKLAAILTLGHAEQRAQDKIEKPTNILTEVVQAGSGIYGTWAQTLLGILQLRQTKTVTGISETDAGNALNVLQPNTR
jgi:PBP1b-binding outer membrane lipoprotein LpoB